MLKEINKVRQIPGEILRRWFSSYRFDLIVWFNSDADINGFQLCYKEGEDERALTWQNAHGFSHMRIDDGERNQYGMVFHKMSPILIPDGVFDKERIGALFKEESGALDRHIADFILQKLTEYPGSICYNDKID